MPEAEQVDTLNPSRAVARLSVPWSANGVDDVTVSIRRPSDERELLLACQAVMVRSDALTLLGQAVAELSPTDPRHEASYAVVDRIRPDWIIQLDRVAAIAARGTKGLTAKATLIASLVERDDADHVQGPPALRIAASLADDRLALGSG